jgi:transcriptional regulator with XRE-family HTH domain
MKVLKEIRENRGVSQRDLASKSGLSFGCIQRLESDAHNWRVGSLRSVARALNLPARGLDLFIEHYVTVVPDSVEDISLRIFGDGFNTWRTHLFNFVDRFRVEPDARVIRNPPVQELDARLRALIASTVESLCAETGRRAPDWCRGIAGLEMPWFVAGVENLKAMALVESPAQFRQRNIFVLGNFLSRA